MSIKDNYIKKLEAENIELKKQLTKYILENTQLKIDKELLESRIHYAY